MKTVIVATLHLFRLPTSIKLVLDDFAIIQRHVQTKWIKKRAFMKQQNKIQSALWTKATVRLLTIARYVNQNVSCHLFVLDKLPHQLVDEIFAETKIIEKEIIYNEGPQHEFKNKYISFTLFKRKISSSIYLALS